MNCRRQLIDSAGPSHLKFFDAVHELLMPLDFVAKKQSSANSIVYIKRETFPFVQRVSIQYSPHQSDLTAWQDGLLCDVAVTVVAPSATFARPSSDDADDFGGDNRYVTRFGLIQPSRHYPKWREGEEDQFGAALKNEGVHWLNEMTNYQKHREFCEAIWRDGIRPKYYGKPYPAPRATSMFGRVFDHLFHKPEPLVDVNAPPTHPPGILERLAHSAFWHDDHQKAVDYLRAYLTAVSRWQQPRDDNLLLLHHLEARLGLPQSVGPEPNRGDQA
jgi:hypothetical protein